MYACHSYPHLHQDNIKEEIQEKRVLNTLYSVSLGSHIPGIKSTLIQMR